MAGIRFVFVVCATCNAEADRIEFDPDANSHAVDLVVEALGVSVEAAVSMVGKANPGAELSSADNARGLADAIVAGQVEGYPQLSCPNGHDSFTVSESNPTPAVSVALAKGI